MSNNKVKVSGYAKRVFFDGGIEYRNFSPDLVGVQLASDGGTPLFTMGNFSITTNMDPKLDKSYNTSKFSEFISLSDLDLTLEQSQTLLTDNAEVILNLDKTNLKYYALFGSLAEFVRVSLEEIITKWPASLYLTPAAVSPTGQQLNGYTFQDYTYDSLSEISTFKVDTTYIKNNYQINYLTNGSILDTFNASNNLRNLTVNFESYVIYYNNNEYPVIGFTGATTLLNDFIYFRVNGNPFSGSVNSNVTYHIKPNLSLEEQFFNKLPDFEAYLLNRQITPKYTSVFKFPIKSDDGVIIYITDTLTWPVSDGYNIDFDTTDYISYATKLFNISTDNDLFSSDLMNRFLVAESISDFDTTPVHLGPLDQDTSGQKMNKTLHIYGREFDDINNFISGIAFAHVVTYDKLDNTPDVYLRDLASVLGWELVSSVLENNLLSNYVTTAPSTYSGQSVGLTAVEADTELWRRLILNTPWIWKSKGARKSIEFLLRFIGAPKGLVQFNEYIYKADAPIDIELFKSALLLNGLDNDISLYPVDSNGYPNPLPNTPNMYFQNDGLWYRETGGSGSTIDILTGNNPHVGPYDGGYRYINQFATLIPNFSAVTVSSTTTTQGSTNLFTNYGLGTITNYSGSTYVDGMFEDGSSLADCVIVTTTIIPDPMPSMNITDCGCESIGDDDSLSICVEKNTNPTPPINCNEALAGTFDDSVNGVYMFQYYQYNPDGSIYNISGTPVLNTSAYANPTCCSAIGGTPSLYNLIISGSVINTGYVCCDTSNTCGCKIACKWLVELAPVQLPVLSVTYSGPQNPYLVFNDSAAGSHVVTADGCNCIGGIYTTTVGGVLDPYTGEVGYGCQLTEIGIYDLTVLGTTGDIYQTYLKRNNGTIGCFEISSTNFS